MKMRVGKKAQVTIFVIVAVVLVGGILLFLLVSDSGRGLVDRALGTEFDVYEDLKECIGGSDKIKTELGEIMVHGGSKNPEFGYMYNGREHAYLCYTNLYYDTCVMQKPLLVRDVREELDKNIRADIEKCFADLKVKMERRGYSVSASKANISIELIPESLVVNLDSDFRTSRGGESKQYGGFEIRVPTKAYDLIMISSSILNFEARYGNADPMTYMMLYPEIRVEKIRRGDDTTVYLVSNRESGEEFGFAVRGVVLPAGYGF